MKTRSVWPVVLLLGAAQTLAWASTFYLPAAIGAAVARDTGLSSTTFFALVTAALIVSALLGPEVGRLTDRWGGRIMLAASTVPITFGLILLSQAEGIVGVGLAWLALSIGMALGLYEVSAAAMAHIFRAEARRAIAYYTLIAGCTSSVGWLMTSWYIDTIGWRGICLTWGLAQIGVALPLYLLLPKVADSAPAPGPRPAARPIDELARSDDNRIMLVMALAFCAGALVVSGLAAHLPHVLSLSGISQKEALAAAALAGPAQILMRLIEAVGFSRRSPLLVVTSSSLLHPIGAALLLVSAPLAPMLFPMLHGMTSGVVITARATVPLTVFGPHGFGVRLGRLSRSIRVVSALAPLLFAILIERLGLGVLWISSGLCLASIIGFGLLRSMMAGLAPAYADAAAKQS